MYVDGHYQTCDVDIWKKYRLLAVDGSTAEVPNSDEIVQDWGVFKVRADGKNICMARTLQVFDPLNRIVVRAAIDKFERSETELFKELLPQISSMEGYGNLWIFNRYFASLELIFRLDGLGDQFCFRMKKDWWKVCESFYKSGEQSRIITITLNKKKAEELTKIGIDKQRVTCRLVRIELEGGESEILLISLLDDAENSVADLRELYGLRWPIETNYRMLKHKLNLENFSGKSLNEVKQVYYAKILILNFAATLVQPIDRLLQDNPKGRKPRKANFTNALSELKYAVVEWGIFGRFKQSLQSIAQFLLKKTQAF